MNKEPGNHESGDNFPSGAEVLANEADNFDPEQAMEARAEKEASMSRNEAREATNETGTESENGLENIYSKEYREEMNAPTSDLFTKRQMVIEQQFPALKPLSAEELRRYVSDEAYHDEIDRARKKVPREVAEEHDLLGRMVGRLDDGIDAYLTPDHPRASSSPNYVPTKIEVEGFGSMVVTEWKAEHSKQDLARMRELHEKNSEIVDFSHEAEVDIDAIPDGMQREIETIARDIKEAAEEAEMMDFLPVGENRPKMSVLYDRINNVQAKNLSYAARKELSQRRHEFQRQYMEARDAVELRDINERIKKLQQEKAAVEERQKKYANAGFVFRLFGRLFNPKRAEREENRANSINNEMEELNRRAGSIGERLNGGTGEE